MQTRDAAHYKRLQNDIKRIANAAKSPAQLVFDFNNLILANGISDKPITYSSQAPAARYASWNIGCGSAWVNPAMPVNTPAGNLDNPTYDRKLRRTNAGHDERMKCCAAIIEALNKKAGFDTITVNEAPGDENDSFYGNSGVVVGSIPKPSGNNRVATFGATNVFAMNDPVHVSIRNLMTTYGIDEFEAQLTRNNLGTYILSVHLEWPKFQNTRSNRINFLNSAIQQNPGLFIMGDANLQHSDLLNVSGDVVGARGCYTCDVIMNQSMYFDKIKDYEEAYIKASYAAQTPAVSSSSAVSSSPVISSSPAVPSSRVLPAPYIPSQTATSSSSNNTSSSSIFSKLGNKSVAAPAPLETKEEDANDLMLRLKEEKRLLEDVINSHTFALTLGPRYVDDATLEQLEEAKMKFPLAAFKVAFMEDFHGFFGSLKTKSEMYYKIMNDELGTMDDVIVYINKTPEAKRSKAIFDDLMNKKDKQTGETPLKFFTQSRLEAFQRDFGVDLTKITLLRGNLGMVQFRFNSPGEAQAFQGKVYQKYQHQGDKSNIVYRGNSPTIIRISQSQYELFCKDYPNRLLPPYEQLTPAEPAKTTSSAPTPTKKQ